MRAMWCGIFHLVHVSVLWHMANGAYEGHMENRKVRGSFLLLEKTKKKKKQFGGRKKRKRRKREKGKEKKQKEKKERK